jgi:hypothetical protein
MRCQHFPTLVHRAARWTDLGTGLPKVAMGWNALLCRRTGVDTSVG